MKILFLSRWFPFPANNGSKIRIYQLIKGLSQLHEVTLFSFYNPDEMTPDPSMQYPFCSEVRLLPWKDFDAKSKKAAVGLFSRSPRSLLDTYSPEMESWIREHAFHQKCDLIIASQLSMASYYAAFGNVPAIFEEIELGLFFDQAFKNDNWISHLRYRLTWLKLQNYFFHLLKHFAACTVVSSQEREIFMEHFPQYAHKVEVLPNCVSLGDYQELKVDRHPHHMVFSGSFRYKPNYYAMQWFAREVLPLILKKIPDAQLIITGDHANLPLPTVQNIMFSGYIDDIKSLIASCDISLAPLWSGGGTRLKILEAMAIGTPVVATSKGAEGLLVQNGKHILIADCPETFAENVVRVLSEKDLRDSLSSNALDLVKENYDWKIMTPKFLGLVDKAVSR